MQIQLGVDAVGGDIGHGADNARGFQAGNKGCLGLFEPLGCDSKPLFLPSFGPMGQTPARRVARNLGIAAHAYKDRCGGGGQLRVTLGQAACHL